MKLADRDIADSVHVMVDLETLGKKPGSVILSIGAVVFDPFGKALGREFYRNLQVEPQVESGLVVDPGTKKWWDDQGPEAQERLAVDQAHPATVIGDFDAWMTSLVFDTQTQIRFWAHDPSFDKAILEEFYRRIIGLEFLDEFPWRYDMARCTRTLYNLTDCWPDRDRGTHHYALDDAKNQAIAVQQAMEELGLARHQVKIWSATGDTFTVFNKTAIEGATRKCVRTF